MRENMTSQMRAAVELRARCRAERALAERAVKEAKGKLARAIDSLARAEASLEGVLLEYLTGETGLPLLDRARNGSNPVVAPVDRGVADVAGYLAAVERQADAERDGVVPDRKQWFEDADEDEAKAKAKIETEETDPVNAWTSADLEVELLHALRRGYERWAKLASEGATADDILSVLLAIWPRGPEFVPPIQSGGRFGYTVKASKPSLVMPSSAIGFWVGVCKGPSHQPTLSGPGLVARIRDVLELPTPAEVAKTKAAKAALAAAFKLAPENGWDGGEMFIAASALNAGKPFSDTACIVCNKCNAMRRKQSHPCPACKSPEFRSYNAAAREIDAAREENRPRESAEDRKPVRSRRPAKPKIPGVLTPE